MSTASAPTSNDSAVGIMMILSPAKTLDLSPLPPDISKSMKLTKPSCNDSQTLEIVKEMKKRKEGELGKLLGISSNLAKTAAMYWKNFSETMDSKTKNSEEMKPCVYAFSGPAYQGLKAYECSESTMYYLQKNLRIVDPVYGTLRPLDVIQPYRLEMATKNLFTSEQRQKMKLADFWKPAVTKSISDDLITRANSERILLNLASDEYSAAVDPSNLPNGTKFVKVVFKDEGRVVAVHAKRARGLMARFVAEKNSESLDDIQKFSEEGYVFVPGESTETTIVFDRRKGKRQGNVGSKSSKRSRK